MLRNKEPELAENIDSSFGCFEIGFYRVRFVFGSRHLIFVFTVSDSFLAPGTLSLFRHLIFVQVLRQFQLEAKFRSQKNPRVSVVCMSAIKLDRFLAHRAQMVIQKPNSSWQQVKNQRLSPDIDRVCGQQTVSLTSIPESVSKVPEGHPQTRSHLAQFDTVGFRAFFA